MDTTAQHRKALNQLASETSCYANHTCLKSDLEDLEEVDIAADGRVLFCFSKNVERCHHSQSFGRVMLCTCPLRQYIATHMHT